MMKTKQDIKNWEERMGNYFKRDNYQVSPNWVDGIIKIFKGVLAQDRKRIIEKVEKWNESGYMSDCLGIYWK